ncbi:MAG: DUF3109 family protein [Alistipes sp.]|jgi:hypothetical protein|nr:DUF3109 family protein [Alistipes sp.]
MIEIDGKIVSTDIITTKFLCDLAACRGICCVEGNAGAPLEPDEARTLAEEFAAYRPYMTEAGVEAARQQGFAVVDSDGDLVTPLVGDAECAYSYNDGGRNDGSPSSGDGRNGAGGVTLCAIEKAWLAGETQFRKPISCHLYPIRVARFGDGSLGLNYHRWAVCDGARTLGREKGVPMFRMLREAIVRRFGTEFFEALEAAEKYLTGAPESADSESTAPESADSK